MTDMIEVRARRTPHSLDLTVFDNNVDYSEFDALSGVLDGRDARTQRLGLDKRLRGYALGLLVDCAARNQLGEAKSRPAHTFITDFVRQEHADPDGDEPLENFDPECFSIPDDGETTPESPYVLDSFLSACTLAERHDPGLERVSSAYAAAGRRWQALADGDRRRFTLRLEGLSATIAELFDGARWWTAYTL